MVCGLDIKRGIDDPCAGITLAGNISPVCHSDREFIISVVFDLNIQLGIYPPCAGTTLAGNISPVWYLI